MRPHLFSIIILQFLIAIPNLAEQVRVSGRVLDQNTREVLMGADILSRSGGTSSDASGAFSLQCPAGETLVVQMIGYESAPLKAGPDRRDIYLIPKVLQGQSIDVAASRVIPGITPVAYTTLRAKDIEIFHATEDVPMILSSAPGVYAYSESGNGTGYSYVSIRGFDQSRIAVMLDNVPLNDNESHQVYWVDHGDILSDAEDVEIQRGVGNSLYGATAFGGSININTRIRSKSEQLGLTVLRGSYDSEKYSIAYKSGTRLGEGLNLTLRGTLLNSGGYRVDSDSHQRSFMAGLEYRSGAWTNQFRAILGKELSVLQWDGITLAMLRDAHERRQKLAWTIPFTDDFYQQIYSLNSRYLINPHSAIRNVAYLVKGSGYYEVDKFGVSFYDYNLDIHDSYPDSVEFLLETDISRKKWIANQYFGLVPIWTYETATWRSDLGFELRQYRGDHFGEVSQFSDSLLQAQMSGPFRYYDYLGSKQLQTAFAHLLYRITPGLTGVIDLQFQNIHWQLNQQAIGHAPGVDLSANWQFVNPRVGLSYAVNSALDIFAGVGKAQKEPADAQIIQADDVWSTPIDAPVERVLNYELGLNWVHGPHHLNLNLYRIEFANEVLQDIYDFQEGVFSVESAEQTLHQGFEYDLGTQLGPDLRLSLNGSIADHHFSQGDLMGNQLSNVPAILANLLVSYQLFDDLNVNLAVKYVGSQYIDQANTEALAIPDHALVDIMVRKKVGSLGLALRLNNVLDEQYATYGYAWGEGYYWPGATRNYSLALNYLFQ